MENGAVTFLTSDLTANKGMDLPTAALISVASGLTGWIGQVVWGWWSDRHGRKFAITVLVIGWAVSIVAFMAISGVGSAWAVLLFWGLFRNAPFPVVYALLIDSVPRAAGTAMGLMIGIALGISGLVSAPVQGWIIDHWGYTAHYLVLAAIALVALLPLSRVRETVAAAKTA